MEKTTNSAMERVIAQMKGMFGFYVGEKATFDSLNETRKKHYQYLVEGIKKMKESGVWTKDELQELANRGDRIILSAYAAAVDHLTETMRDNWKF